MILLPREFYYPGNRIIFFNVFTFQLKPCFIVIICMDTNELRRGNAVLYDNKILIIENVHKNSVNLEIEKTTDSKGDIFYQVKDWINKDLITPLPLNRDTLKRLKFRQEIDSRYRLLDRRKTIFVNRHIDKYFLSVNNSFNEIVELKNVHHLQNIVFYLLDIELFYK